MAMNWNCPKCGLENPESVRTCDGCGYTQFGRLVLTSIETGKNISFGIDTIIGNRLLSGFAGKDSIYASSPQFVIKKDATLKSWTICHAADAKNPTFLNGSALEGPSTVLNNGDVLSIGPEKMKLAVSIDL